MTGVHATWTAGWIAEVCIFFVTYGKFALVFQEGTSQSVDLAHWGAVQWIIAGAAFVCFGLCVTIPFTSLTDSSYSSAVDCLC